MRSLIDIVGRLIEGWQPDDLEAYAAYEHNHIYGDHEPGGGQPNNFDWRFDPAYPINKTIDGLTPKARIRWMRKEITMHAEDGRPDQYTDMLNEEITEPIVITEVENKTYIWDGNHRVGASLMTGRTTVPAVIGTPK